jgi:hypothetical protein
VSGRRKIDTSLPTWFKVLWGFCFLLGLAFLGLAGWAVITLVNWATSR